MQIDSDTIVYSQTVSLSFYTIIKIVIMSLKLDPVSYTAFSNGDKVTKLCIQRAHSIKFSIALGTTGISFFDIAWCCAVVFLLMSSKSSNLTPEINFRFRKHEKGIES